MTDSYFRVDGLASLMMKIDQLPLKVGYKAMRTAGKRAMKPVENEMRQRAHRDTGDLADAITTTARKGKNGDTAVVIRTGPTRKRAKGRTLKKVNQKAIAQEYGNELVKADPFIRPAMDNNKDRVLENLKRNLARELEKGFK